MSLISNLKEWQLLPLYTSNDLALLDIVEETLIYNGLPVIEVTFRSKLAPKAIEKLSNSGNIVVGAGTVRCVEEAKVAVESGARFIVSPSISDEVISYCIDNKILIIPGVSTPYDIQRGLNYGLKTLKFFPADIYGGVKAIKSFSGPFYDVDFLPTGGINIDNMNDYLKLDNVVAVGGSFALSEETLKKDPEAARENLAKIIKKIKI